VDTFNPATSQTYRGTGVERTVEYYGQEECRGEESWDVLVLEGENGRMQGNASFLLVSWEYRFQSLVSDGLFVGSMQGFGYPSEFLRSVSLPKELFSLYLADNSFTTLQTSPRSALLLGETDTKTYGTGAGMGYVGIVGTEGWVVQLTKVGIGSVTKYFGDSMLAVFDAGIRDILIPPLAFAWLTSTLSSLGNCGFTSFQFTCDCSAFYSLSDYPALSLSFPSLSVLLLSTQYFYIVTSTHRTAASASAYSRRVPRRIDGYSEVYFHEPIIWNSTKETHESD